MTSALNMTTVRSRRSPMGSKERQGPAFDALSGSVRTRAQREIFRKHIGHDGGKKHRNADPEQRRMMDAPPVAPWGVGLGSVMGAISRHVNLFPPCRRRTMEPSLGGGSQRRFITTISGLKSAGNAIHGEYGAEFRRSHGWRGSRSHHRTRPWLSAPLRSASPVCQTAADRRAVTDAQKLSRGDDGSDRLGSYPRTSLARRWFVSRRFHARPHPKSTSASECDIDTFLAQRGAEVGGQFVQHRLDRGVWEMTDIGLHGLAGQDGSTVWCCGHCEARNVAFVGADGSL